MDSEHKYCKLNREEVEEKQEEVKNVKYKYKISSLDAFWNTCSSIQGLGLLAMPLAASYGGYWYILGTIAVAAFSCYTSKILVQCLYEVHPTKGRIRTRDTYSDVGEAFWPHCGRQMVLVAKFLELMFSATANPIACAEALAFLCPNLPVSTRMWILIFGIGMTANIFLTSIAFLSKISMMTIILGFGTFGTVIGYSLHQIPKWDFDDMLVFQPSKFPLSLGMLVASYSAQIYLTVLEVSMKSPEKFNSILNYGYTMMTVLKLALGVFGYLAFSKDVNEVVTNNLPTYFLIPMNIIVVFLAFTGYSLPIFAVFDMIESSANRFLGTRCLDGYGQRPKPLCKYLLRLIIVLITIVMATVVPYFSLILAFVGSISGTSIAVIFPCLFHIKLYWDYLQWYQVVVDIVIAFFGVMMAVSGVTYSLLDLMEIMSQGHH
ncbi:vesicular inhibitory amino acid transporter-like [Exaiptasia diaphana]|uniref:Amino acid transporter transmembrane domain-containing protein n=1 Tax=Exaiptasia diaphana TaxID=2652724 RepID=A0A913WW25_EXADI|nr:vesicular inhibitory amino acid transporter-like [Exaiptasia diaphana]